MISTKFVTVIVFLTQLYAHGLCDSKDDAQNAINLLYGQVQSASRLVSITAANMWSADVSNMSQTIYDQLVEGIDQFKLLVYNATVFAENYPSAYDCIGQLDIFLNVSNYRVDAIDIENDVFRNLYALASVDLQNGFNKYTEINQEFIQNCLQTESSCEGLSAGIVAEVDRYLPLIKRIPYRLFAEIYLLNFRVALNWRTVQVIIMEDYHKVLENTTICLANAIKQYNQTSLELPQTSEDLGDSILELYDNLVLATDVASSSAILDLGPYVDDIMQQMTTDYIATTITGVRNVTFIANNTVFDIKDIAVNLNITINCTTPDIQSVFISALTRTLDDFEVLLDELSDRQYQGGLDTISVITKEIASIQLQVATCEAEGTCDYLSEKIVSKTSEIPLMLQKLRDSTSVLFLRSVPAVWKSGINAAKDLLDQLEVEIVNLKSCVQSYF